MKKQTIIKLFLEFVGGFLPIREAWLATLGGGGVEPAIWKEIGLPEKQGWLIESSREKSVKLIREFPYSYCSQLAAFPQLFTSVTGLDGGVDGFHLDLCGTFEGGNIRELFGTILPLVMRSRGRCFAITVADARFNKSLMEFDAVQAELIQLIGEDEVASFLSQLIGEQERDTSASDSRRGAQRELGFATELISLMVEERLYELDRIQRYRYVSDTYGGNFPMRTYFFHFSKRGRGRRPLLRAHDTIALWRQSTLQEVTAEGIINLLPVTGVKESEMGTPYPNLGQLVALASPVCQSEFQELLEDALRGKALKKAGFDLAPSHGLNGVVKATPVRSMKTPSVSDATISVQIDLVVARSKGSDAYDEVEQASAKALGISRKKNRFRTLGSYFARTQGKFRANFVKRVLDAGADEAVLTNLAEAYSAITGEAVTAEGLRTEALQ